MKDEMTAVKSFDVTSFACEIDARLRAMQGAGAATLRALRREFSKRLATAPARVVVAIASDVLDRDPYASRFFAYELIKSHPAALASLTSRAVERLGRGIASWGDVDCFACFVAGPAWRARQIPDSLVHRWTRSSDRWWRRAALVATVPLNARAHGGTGDAKRTLAVCRLLLDDRDEMVVKGMSWALRALAKPEPGAVRDFLAANAAALAPRVARETRNKLATGLKNPRRASVSRFAR